MLQFLTGLGCVAAFGIVYCLLINLHTYAPAMFEAIIARIRNNTQRNSPAAKPATNGRVNPAAAKKLASTSKSG